jgi:hypothetical protein
MALLTAKYFKLSSPTATYNHVVENLEELGLSVRILDARALLVLGQDLTGESFLLDKPRIGSDNRLVSCEVCIFLRDDELTKVKTVMSILNVDMHSAFEELPKLEQNQL